MRASTLDWRHKAIATACLALCGAAWSAPFTPGNLVAYRVGTGTGALPVFLDEYRVDGTLVQSLPLSGGATPLTASSKGSGVACGATVRPNKAQAVGVAHFRRPMRLA